MQQHTKKQNAGIGTSMVITGTIHMHHSEYASIIITGITDIG
jgi:hypothetical protein